MSDGDLRAAREALRRHFGHDAFRPTQERAIEAALGGRDVLAVLPTGFGKSACFQIPALLDDGLTLVVSPLVSLIDDQVAGARGRGIPALGLSSARPGGGLGAARRAIEGGRLKLLYLAPERLESDGLRDLLGGRRIARWVVDEAHCIAEWGHDFRPSYRSIGRVHRSLGGAPLMALTATATRATRREIERSLALRRPVRILMPVDRPNVHLAVRRVRGLEAAMGELALEVRAAAGPAIIYAGSRDRSARLALALRRLGVRAAAFHARLPDARKRRVQQGFLSGEVRVVCATTAFGMGIDHPEIRLVGHLGLPRSLEAYVQGVGRAGRDGRAARAVLWVWRRGRDRWRPGADGSPGSPHGPDRVRYEAALEYARHRGCRRAAIAAYFGERPPSCAGCDRCDGDRRGDLRSDDVQGRVKLRTENAISSSIVHSSKSIATSTGKPRSGS